MYEESETCNVSSIKTEISLPYTNMKNVRRSYVNITHIIIRIND